MTNGDRDQDKASLTLHDFTLIDAMDTAAPEYERAFYKLMGMGRDLHIPQKLFDFNIAAGADEIRFRQTASSVSFMKGGYDLPLLAQGGGTVHRAEQFCIQPVLCQI